MLRGNNFRSSYKKRSFCFGDNDGKRILRADKLNEDRKDRRRNAFQTGRQIVEESSPLELCVPNKEIAVLKEVSRNENRLAALKKWKVEKENKLKLLKKIEKPVFKVSVVKHKVYSPPTCFCNKENCKSVACCESKLKVKKEDKVLICATPQPSRKPYQLSSSQKKILPIVDSGRVKRMLQPQVENVGKPTIGAQRTSPAISLIKKDKKMTSFATPQSTRKPNQMSSSRKVLAKVDSGRVNRARLQVEDVGKSAMAVPGVSLENNYLHGVGDLEKKVLELNSSCAQDLSSVTDQRSKSPLPNESREEKAKTGEVDLSQENITECSRIAASPKLEPDNMLNELKLAEVVEEVPEDETQKKRQQAIDSNDVDFPAMHSPYITVTRGKNRSDFRRKDFNSPGVFSSTPTRYLQDLSNMLSELDEDKGVHGVNYFRLKLNMELGMLHGLCDYWSAVQKLNDSNFGECRDLIDSAVGQSKLLITKKMAQFETLIRDCEKETGEKLVTVDDLQGFWDVMFMQVIDVRKRFYALEELYLNSEQKNEANSKNKNTKKRSKKNVAKPKVEAKSSMRAMIAAARKRQKQESSANPGTNEDIILSENVTEPVPATPSARKRQKQESSAKPNTNEDILLSENVTEPVPATPSRITPRRRSASLHQQVLVRESRRKTVTWNTATSATTTKDREESLSVSINTTTATPKSALKKKLATELLVKSDERTRDMSSVHFQDAEVTGSSPKLEYSVTPYVRRSRRSRFSITPKNANVPDDIPCFETPVEEPARVRRSKRLGSTALN